MNNIRITLATSSVISLYAIGCFIWKRLRKYKRGPRLNMYDINFDKRNHQLIEVKSDFFGIQI